MAITQAQVNAGKALVLDRLFKRYSASREPAIRIAVQAAKQGNPTEREVAKYILQEAYQAINGIDPVGRHAFQHFVADGLNTDPDDPTTGVDQGDLWDAAPIEVTP